MEDLEHLILEILAFHFKEMFWSTGKESIMHDKIQLVTRDLLEAIQKTDEVQM